jgi:CHAD domain-containing protein
VSHDAEVEAHDPSTVDGFVRDLIRRSAAKLVAADHEVREGDPDAIHRARVSTRRLRSDLATLRPVLRRRDVDPIRDELQWLGGHLGSMRDLQVLRGHLQHLADELDDVDPWPEATLWNQLDAGCARERSRMIDAMSGARYVQLLHALDELAADPPFRRSVDVTAPARPVMRRAARDAWRRAVRTAERLEPSPGDEALHELRKRIKRARYAAQAARRVGADPSPGPGELRRMQDHLGELHDAVVAAAWLRDATEGLDPATAFLAGRLHEAAMEQRCELRRTWRTEWDRLT